MVYVIKAFGEFVELINNTKNAVTSAGELSPLAKSYSRNLRTYSNVTSQPGTSLHVFSCKVNDVEEEVPNAAITRPLEIAHALVTEYTGGSSARTFLEGKFGDLTSITVESDVIVGASTLVEKLECNFPMGSDSVRLVLYFSNSYFEDNYDEYEIRVVPPIVPVGQLQDSYNNVLALLNSVDGSDLATLEDSARDGIPQSHRRVYNLRWTGAGGNTLMTTWTILGYGKDSMRTDNILKGIRDYLLDNHGSTIEQWKTYLPDIQVEDNFTFIPLWDQVAVSAGGSIDAYYRSVVTMGDVSSIGAENFSTRSKDEYASVAEVVMLYKKSLPMVVIGGLGNSNEETFFGTMYPDYALFSVNDPVSGEISSTTISAISALETLAALCETYTSGSSLPGNVTLETIGTKKFLETTVDGMSFKMLVSSDFVRP